MKATDTQALRAEEAAALAEVLRPAELSVVRRGSLRERILRRVSAPAPAHTLTVRGEDGDWIRVGPLAEVKILRRRWEANNQSMLVRLAPGAVVARHTHTQEEECVVLEGEVIIGEHVFRAGDAHFALPGAAYTGLRTMTGCLLFIRSEIPPELPRPVQPGGS